MRVVLSALAVVLGGCATDAHVLSSCATVAAVRENQQYCFGKIVRIEAHLISTRHGEYLADTTESRTVLAVSIPEAGDYAKPGKALLDILNQSAHMSVVEVHGSFVGRISRSSAGAPVLNLHRFDID
jgi:hypothetical protein